MAYDGGAALRAFIHLSGELDDASVIDAQR
jgi:hypothetical protein